MFRKDLAISTLGRSFWILDDVSPLHALNPRNRGFRFFKPRDVDGGVQNIYFTLPEDRGDPTIRFEFLRGGELVHAKEESLINCPAGPWNLRKTQWDLKYYLPNGGKDFQGPLVVPGEYTVRIVYGEKTSQERFRYLLHPELALVGTVQADLEEQEKLALQIARLLMAIKKEIRMLEESVARTRNKKKKDLLISKLSTLKKGPNRYDQPRLQEQVAYLYEMVTKVPQKPGRDAFERYQVLKAQWERLESI